jgi:hypothetical protein
MTEATARTAPLSGTELHTAAVTGGFAVDETTGNRMIRSLEAMHEALESRWARLRSLAESPRIGSTPAAHHVAARMVETAADDRGLLTQLQAARAEIPRYVEAISLAKRNYAEREHTGRTTLRHAGRDQ